MPLAATNLEFPLTRDTTAYDQDKRSLIWAVGAIAILAALASVPLLLMLKPVGLATAVGAVGAGAYVYRWTRKKPSDTLRVDQNGVHFTRDGHALSYGWDEIHRVREIVISPAGRYTPEVRGVQIQAKGRIYAGNDLVDYLQPEHFGLTNRGFEDLLEDGVRRWASPPDTPESAAADNG